MKQAIVRERELRSVSGFFPLFAIIVGLIVSTGAFVHGIIFLEAGRDAIGAAHFVGGMLGWALFGTVAAGLKIIRPNEARVFTLFGKYHGTIKSAGFHYVNPFCISFSPTYNEAKAEAKQKAKEATKQGGTNFALNLEPKTVSLKTQTHDSKRQKVNDILGNPIIIGTIVIWHVEDPTQAVFAVENYREYLATQTDSTIRNAARLYPYDVFSEDEYDDAVKEKTLRGSALEIAETMKEELQKRVVDAGLVIEEVRITHLAYAEEIAAAMLQRQQASAIIAARKKIVDGAVGMVKMAIDKLGDDDIVLLDEERKAAMVSNLLVVLCGNRDAQPIVNSGSIY
jgi:regulator of protease activity HflC (stomatin/prohibitin superfamily)